MESNYKFNTETETKKQRLRQKEKNRTKFNQKKKKQKKIGECIPVLIGSSIDPSDSCTSMPTIPKTLDKNQPRS
jgi:hypothetical protein